MQDVLEKSLTKLKKIRIRKKRMIAILLILSSLVSLDVFWTLRKPGLTLAGDADCKKVEHTHNSLCGEWCSIEEHVHSVKCYSDDSSDVETLLDWQNLFHGYPYTGNLREDLVGIAKTQVGYSESEDNFEVGSDGKRRGYSRYGAWYGMPYGEWSAAFVSFCLNYAKGDLTKNPINSGAFSMMELWKKQGKFSPLGKYVPVVGDLVFFRDNTVGIVSEVYNSTVSVIKGDLNDSVCRTMVLIKDPSIIGWGITGGVFINDGLSPIVKIEAELTREEKTISTYNSKGNSIVSQISLLSARTTPSGTELVPYLKANGGSHFFTILDNENKPLPKDSNGNFIVIENTGYNLTLSFSSPHGILPGTYWYQLPDGLVVDSGDGDFILSDGTNVGNWTVSDDGLITFVFNDNINTRTDIIISATMGAHFVVQDDPIDFDGKITISVQKPPEDAGTTIVTKWGMQGNENNTSGKNDPNKIYWNVSITGNKNSHIPGSIVSDKILVSDWTGVHEYTQADMEAGIKFGASDPQNNWHAWTVYPGDPNLTWTTDGWTYIMPDTIRCWCGEVTLGNEGWIYYVDYSSTPDLLVNPGTAYYMNRISADNHYADSGSQFTGEVHGVIKKGGKFVTDANGAAFVWEIQAAIPGRKAGQKPDYSWYVADYLYLVNNEGTGAGYVENTAHLSKVTVSYKGTIIDVPRIQDATENDLFAWDNQWSGNQDGVNYLRAINLLHRCDCHGDNCFWGISDDYYWYKDDDGIWKQNGFCQCWTPEEDVVFTFVYRTEDLSLLEKYGGMGYKLQNVAELYYQRYGDDSTGLSTGSQQAVPVPSIMKKELTKDFDGYTASYRITVNESKLTLTNGTPLNIRDEMTQTLAYIAGSLVVTSEDRNGNITTLVQDADYTITYDGSGNEKDENGNPVHVLEIVIFNPQPVMYILDYDTTLIIPSGVTEAVKYSNTASVTMWGEDIESSSVEKVYADINISAKKFKVEMKKTCALTHEPLEGAVFGIFNEHGGLIATDTTHSDGLILFQTNVIEGIILREHVFYYIMELKAPPGYKLDDKKYWFCFCDDPGESCTFYKESIEHYDAIRIPYQQLGHIYAVNHLLNYNLPSTGGIGVYPLILLSVIFIITPLVYRFIIKLKRKKRGMG